MTVRRKMYVGVSRFMVPVPRALSAIAMRKSVAGARAKADLLSEEERTIHHFVVRELAVAQAPVTPDLIGERLEVPVERVVAAVDKLEAMMTFVYRENSDGINWAYPLSLQNTGHEITVSTGDRFFSAWAVDAIATPIVYGRLQNKRLSVNVDSSCAHSGKPIRFTLDTDLHVTTSEDTPGPMFCVPLIDTARSTARSILDIFWRKSLFFWSEEEARQYQSRTRARRFYMNLNRATLESVEQVQLALFGFGRDAP